MVGYPAIGKGWDLYTCVPHPDPSSLLPPHSIPLGLLMKGKVESEKVGLKLNIQKTKIMASGPITSWEIAGETVETVADFILGGSKITADGYFTVAMKLKDACSLEGKL